MLGTIILAATMIATTATTIPVDPTSPRGKKVERKIADIADIDGIYSVTGTDRDGKGYVGVAIVQRRDQVFVMQWNMIGGMHYNGVGIRHGDILSMAWSFEGAKGITTGVTVYQIKATQQGPVLVGTWASRPGNAKQLTERAIFRAPLDTVENDD